ncbi:hypothetical protein ACROYT_G039896 [Oculina patagonica]
MSPCLLYFAFLHVIPLKAEQNHLDGSRGLKRGVHVQGERVSYGNFAVDKFHRLQGTVGSSTLVSNYSECALSCVNNPPCSSFNVASSPRSDGKYRCELLNEDKYSANPGQLVSSQEYHHYSIKTPCSSFPCQNGAKCVPNYGENQYHCDCVPGYKGSYCETDIDECASDPCLNRATCVDQVNGYVCNCQPGYAGVHCQTMLRSCQDLYGVSGSSQNQQVTLFLGSTLTTVLCHMGDFGCGDGGWTPVMKMDGSKGTFHFNSALWSNQNHYNSAAWVTGFDSQEAKLPTYWNTPFSKICLGMKIGQQIKFIVMSWQASSLYSLIADGHRRATSLSRSTWMSLMGSHAYLEPHCNRQGFNVLSDDSSMGKARIGILANNENDCVTCDTRMGFGTGGRHNDAITCGNHGQTALGYILVQ